jgi:hypothetical protein
MPGRAGVIDVPAAVRQGSGSVEPRAAAIRSFSSKSLHVRAGPGPQRSAATMHRSNVRLSWPALTLIPLALALPVGFAPAAAASAAPSAPHLFALRGLGGCELDARIGLSSEPSVAPSALRYELLSDGVPVGRPVTADTRGSAAGFGNLDLFAAPSPHPQRFTIVAIDPSGAVSAPSNALTRTITSCG